jgi:glycosyltransferase involved in cell wall biosynthesis
MAFLDRRYHNQRLRWYLMLLTKMSLRRAARVIAVSQFTKDTVLQHFPTLEDKVRVVHSGLDHAFEERDTSNGHTGGRPYILFVGSIEPRKNLPRLIRAFEIAMAETGLKHDLVFCGPWGWRYQGVVAAWEGSPLRERIRHAGYVPANDLPALYAGADLLAYPSLQEGFGFPVLEAMASGTPVVTSNVAALPEIAGDAALMVPPTNTDAIAGAIASVLTNPDLAGDLVERGRRRARPFTWSRAAAETLSVYREAMSAGT